MTSAQKAMVSKPKTFGLKGRSIGNDVPVFNSLKTHNLYTYRNNQNAVSKPLEPRTAANKIKQFQPKTQSGIGQPSKLSFNQTQQVPMNSMYNTLTHPGQLTDRNRNPTS